jgi:hypothetical protein
LKLPITTLEGAAETAIPPVIVATPTVSPHARAKLIARRIVEFVCSIMSFPLFVP